jgi:hypothetical protein
VPGDLVGRKPSLVGDLVQRQRIVEMTLDPLDQEEETINTAGVRLIHVLIVAHPRAPVLTAVVRAA